METAVQKVLAQTGTKTSKIRQLILMGFTRRQIAEWAADGNYGFVQNVYAKIRAAGELNLNGAATPLQ